jgi:hypothetical protein
MQLVHIATRADSDPQLDEALRGYIDAARQVVEACALAQQHKASLGSIVTERLAAGVEPAKLRRQLLDAIPNPDTANAIMRAATGQRAREERNRNQLEMFA